MTEGPIGKVYQWPEGLRQFLDDEKRTFIAEMWRIYQETRDKNGNGGDYTLLADICASALSDQGAEISQEVVRVLMKHNPSKADRVSLREKEQILRLWDNFKKHDPATRYDSLHFRKAISQILGGSSRYSPERIRGIIRERDKNLDAGG